MEPPKVSNVTVCEVRTMAQFFEALAEVRAGHVRAHRGPVSNFTFFRGHAESGWSLAPRLFRERLHHDEQNLVSDALSILPDEFAGAAGFPQLAKMQHLGLPTRLLDVTTNPLVALFFACYGSPSEAGEVITFPNLPTFQEPHLGVEIVMDFVFSGAWRAFNPIEARRRLSIFGRSAIEQAEIHSALTTPWTAVLPKQTNPRLRAQSGAFIVFGMTTIDPPTATGWDFEPVSLSDPIGRSARGGEQPTRISIPASAKAPLLAELALVDTTGSRLFPEPEHQIRFVYENYLASSHAPFISIYEARFGSDNPPAGATS